MNKQLLLVLMLCTNMLLVAWSGSDASGNQPVFFGKLTSHEGRTFNVTNIMIGRSESAGRSVRVYEMPRTPASATGKDMMMIPVNPHHDLTTTELDLLKVKKIAVPHPQTSWIWEKPATDARTPVMRYEFIELEVTWHGSQPSNYLLELGTEHTTKPVKIFCDSTNVPVSSITPGNTQPVFCVGIKQSELRKKGAPFPSIKELIIEGHCYEAPRANGIAGVVKSHEEPIAPTIPVAESIPAAQPIPVVPQPEQIQSTPEIVPAVQHELVPAIEPKPVLTTPEKDMVKPEVAPAQETNITIEEDIIVGDEQGA